MSLADFKRWIALNTQILEVSKSWVSFWCLWNTLCSHRPGACVIDAQCKSEGWGTWSQCGLRVGVLAHQSNPHPPVEPHAKGPSEPLFASHPCTRWVAVLHSFDAGGVLNATLIG